MELKLFDDFLVNEESEISFQDFSELEDLVTPGSGSGCNCAATD